MHLAVKKATKDVKSAWKYNWGSYHENLSGSNGIPYCMPPGMTGTLVALLSAIKLIFIAKSAIRKIWNRVHLAVKKQLKVCVNASSDPILPN